MTDKEIADKVYIEPITLEFVTRILRKERPDALLPTLGGQTGLNMAMELSKAGILEELGVVALGTKLSAIDQAEDRDLFKQLMEDLEQPIPESEIVNTVEEAVAFASEIGYQLSCVLPLPLVVLVVVCVPTKKNFVKSLKMA